MKDDYEALFYSIDCGGNSCLFYVASSGAAYRPIAHCDNDTELLHTNGYLLRWRVVANVGIRERQGIGLLRSANTHPDSPNIDTHPDSTSTNVNTNTLHHLCALCGERKLINE